jgi:hypothetical protein
MNKPLPLLLTLLFVAAVALAFDADFHSRIITPISSTLTINVQNDQFVTITNFTQEGNASQRGTVFANASTPTPSPTPTVTPIPTATATPTSTDLTATKTDNVGGQATFPSSWTWTISVANGGNTAGTFTSGKTILSDNLPNSNINYGSALVSNSVSVTGTISCSITASFDLICTASGDVTIGPGGSFDISLSATPTTSGTYVNPRTGGSCLVDPDNVVSESNDSNNTCGDTVVSNAPATPTPAPRGVMTATILDPKSPPEFIRPVVIQGPSVVTIPPVTGATLFVSYRKEHQSTPTPAPTATTSSTFAPTTSVITAPTKSAQPSRVLIVRSPDSDDDDWEETPAPAPTVSPSATVASTVTPSPTATGTPSPTASPTPTPTP